MAFDGFDPHGQTPKSPWGLSKERIQAANSITAQHTMGSQNGAACIAHRRVPVTRTASLQPNTVAQALANALASWRRTDLLLGANVRIGEAASKTGVTVKAIRHYEAVGLLGVLEREGAYREFSADDLERLRLIAYCRDLGFGLPEIRRVLEIVADAQPSCPDPEAMIDVVDGRLRAINEQIARFQQLSERLEHTRAYLQRRLHTQRA